MEIKYVHVVWCPFVHSVICIYYLCHPDTEYLQLHSQKTSVFDFCLSICTYVNLSCMKYILQFFKQVSNPEAANTANLCSNCHSSGSDELVPPEVTTTMRHEMSTSTNKTNQILIRRDGGRKARAYHARADAARQRINWGGDAGEVDEDGGDPKKMAAGSASGSTRHTGGVLGAMLSWCVPLAGAGIGRAISLPGVAVRAGLAAAPPGAVGGSGLASPPQPPF